MDADAELDSSEDYLAADRLRRQRISSYAKSAASFLVSHLGLAAMVVGYSVMGGFLFKALEAPHETKEKLRIRSFKEGKLVEIQQLADLLCVRGISAENFTDLVGQIQLQFQQQVTLAVKNNGWDGKDETDETTLQWSFAGSLLYAVTVITTIGYGHVAPKTTAGRLVTIIYALVGIPLTFLYLSNMGNFMAECFRLFYKKICCKICIYCMRSRDQRDVEDAKEDENELAQEEEDQEIIEMAARRNFAFLSVEEEEEEEAARVVSRPEDATGNPSPNRKSWSGRGPVECSGQRDLQVAADQPPRSSGSADETTTAVSQASDVEIRVPNMSSSPAKDSDDPTSENIRNESQCILRRSSPPSPRNRDASHRLSNGGNRWRDGGSDAPGFGTPDDGQQYIPLRTLPRRTVDSQRTPNADRTSRVGFVAAEASEGKLFPTAEEEEAEDGANGQSDDRRQRLMYGRMMAAERTLRTAGSVDSVVDSSEVTVPISICLLIIGVYIFSGSLLFTIWEDWDYLTGSYFCFVTLSTIGFGDIVPGTDMKEWEAHKKLILCSLWLVVGLSLLAMCFNLMQEEVKDWCRWMGHRLGILKD